MLIGRFLTIACPRGCGIARCKEGHPAELGHVPDGKRPIRRHARRGSDHCLGFHLLPRPGSRTRARTSPASGRPDFLKRSSVEEKRIICGNRADGVGYHGVSGGWMRACCEQSGHVRRGGRLHRHDGHLHDNLLSGGPFWFNAQISLWLWFTVLFANFAEALAEGRGKAQAETSTDVRRARHMPGGSEPTGKTKKLRPFP